MKLSLFFLFFSLLIAPFSVWGITSSPDASLPQEKAEQADIPVGTNLPTTSPLLKEGPQEKKMEGKAETDKQPPFRRWLLSAGIRAAFSNSDMIGSVAREGFRECGAAANFRLPWESYSRSNWGIGLRLMTSLGVLYTDKDTALVATLIPLVAFGSKDGRFTLDMGAGGALLSRRDFGRQDYGGYIQFALTAGIGVPLYKRLGAGYRFQHYSDAGIYGPHTVGADLHMFELTYRF
jgi:hypothetical protein